jgi:phospholipid/cholesterol/gamma-HCH transport system ATP-binding protein
VVTVVGGSGTGKSVLLRLLTGLLKPDRGRIEVFGQDIVPLGEAALRDVRRRVALLFQGGALFDSLDVHDNVAYGPRAHGVDEAEVERRVERYLAHVGLPGIGAKLPAQLSGGMQKRVALARTIAVEPDVVLFDEPNTGLDPVNTRRINELIMKTRDEQGRAAVVITHDLESALAVSDRLALLHDRRLPFVGTPDEPSSPACPSAR